MTENEKRSVVKFPAFNTNSPYFVARKTSPISLHFLKLKQKNLPFCSQQELPLSNRANLRLLT